MKTGQALPAANDPAVASTAVTPRAPPSAAVAPARAFALPLIEHLELGSGENALDHADAVAAIVRASGGSGDMQAAAYLVHAVGQLAHPQEAIAAVFGPAQAALAMEVGRLLALETKARRGTRDAPATGGGTRLETARRMLLAFSRDLRVVMLRLASRLQTLRWHAASKVPPDAAMATESLEVFAPLANRLGIWQLKWEIEDLAFRFLEPGIYRTVAASLEMRRVEREAYVESLRGALERELAARGVGGEVSGRPKHIHSIVRKMRAKSLDFGEVFDVRALRVVVPQIADCYTALAVVHERFAPVDGQFDDYISRPKANGYQSLHTVVRDGRGLPLEVQIRTRAMHEHAEHGVAAHWAYKEGAQARSTDDHAARIAVLRQLLAWERDVSSGDRPDAPPDDRLYVLTPDAAIVELARGATPIDFAYAVHTQLGHRCRGARVDGALVPLSTPLASGQTVEIMAAKEGGPSRDWLGDDPVFLASPRAKAKVRAWFNERARQDTITRGRAAVEKTLQREGRTAIRLEDLAARLGLDTAEDLFLQVGKDELSLRSIELVLRPPEASDERSDDALTARRPSPLAAPGRGLLVVGVDSLMTQLASCCRPAPPDSIAGFVTRGRGVSVHRSDCGNFRHMASRSAERVIEVAWGATGIGAAALYPVDVRIEANDRQGLLRDISEVFARHKTNVTGVRTQSTRGEARMTFTLETADAARLASVLTEVSRVAGVVSARRR